ncbi:MAG TPA: hypothetical protein VEL76_19790 [Gemmataceae bacterium]|nr:hypothetical protein [Gemmataceae bacterium]
MKLFAVVRRYALRLAGALRRGRQLRAVLAELVEEMGRVRRQPKRYTRPSTRQLLEDPELAA